MELKQCGENISLFYTYLCRPAFTLMISLVLFRLNIMLCYADCLFCSCMHGLNDLTYNSSNLKEGYDVYLSPEKCLMFSSY